MINEIHSDANSRMDKSLASLENDFSKIRAGRAHPSLLEQVTVEYYGAMVPLSQGLKHYCRGCKDIEGFALGKGYGWSD
jgi:hypothetical protein